MKKHINLQSKKKNLSYLMKLITISKILRLLMQARQMIKSSLIQPLLMQNLQMIRHCKE